jgi:hypothetical protein
MTVFWPHSPSRSTLSHTLTLSNEFIRCVATVWNKRTSAHSFWVHSRDGKELPNARCGLKGSTLTMSALEYEVVDILWSSSTYLWAGLRNSSKTVIYTEHVTSEIAVLHYAHLSVSNEQFALLCGSFVFWHLSFISNSTCLMGHLFLPFLSDHPPGL